MEKRRNNVEKEMRKKKKVRRDDLKLMDKHRKILQYWKNEAERRERKQMMKQLPPNAKGYEQGQKNKHTHSQPVSSLYPQLTALTLDPDLDACPTGRRQPDLTGPTSPPNVGSHPLHPPAYDGGAARTVYGDPDAPGPSHQMPMIEVAGLILVHRAWTKDDIDKAESHLPDLKTSGNAFVPAFQAFCQEFRPTMLEIKRMLGTTMSATDYQKILSKLTGNQRCVHPVYDHQDNAPYRQALQDLLEEIKKLFPDRLDMSKITSCRQKPDEMVEDYLTHLIAVFDQNSGIDRPPRWHSGAVGNAPQQLFSEWTVA